MGFEILGMHFPREGTIFKGKKKADFGGASGYIFPSDVQAAILK